MEILKDSPSHVTRDLSQHSTEVTAGSDWGEEPGQRSQGLRINAGGNEGVQLEDKMLYGNQIKILCIEIYTFNSQDDFSRMKTLKYWSQNMKDEKRDRSHPLKLMKVWFDLKTISIAELMVRKEIKLCIMAAFQESGAEDRDMQENRKIHYKDFFFLLFILSSFRTAFCYSFMNDFWKSSTSIKDRHHLQSKESSKEPSWICRWFLSQLCSLLGTQISWLGAILSLEHLCPSRRKCLWVYWFPVKTFWVDFFHGSRKL